MLTLTRVVRILIGFALASLAAAATLVAFVYAPGDWASLRSELNGERLSEAGLFALVVTPWVAFAAAVPALAGAALAEKYKIAGWTYYALAGIGTAAAGFLVQHLSATPGRPSIFEAYALIAFLTAGLVGGLVYWLFSGRHVV
jgi:hypothetical protein